MDSLYYLRNLGHFPELISTGSSTLSNGHLTCDQLGHMSPVMRKPDLAYAKTKTQISFAVTTKVISAFVFHTWTVQSLYFLNLKFQVSTHPLWFYSPVCAASDLVGNPEYRFSCVAAHISSMYHLPEGIVPISLKFLFQLHTCHFVAAAPPPPHTHTNMLLLAYTLVACPTKPFVWQSERIGPIDSLKQN